MSSSGTSMHFDLQPRGFAITVASMVLLVLCCLSGSMTEAYAQAHAYVTNACSNNISVIDTATDQVISVIPVGIAPLGVAITPDGARAYVPNAGRRVVAVIDTANNQVIGMIPVGADPFLVAITPDGTRAYVTNQSSHSVSAIDTA